MLLTCFVSGFSNLILVIIKAVKKIIKGLQRMNFYHIWRKLIKDKIWICYSSILIHFERLIHQNRKQLLNYWHCIVTREYSEMLFTYLCLLWLQGCLQYLLFLSGYLSKYLMVSWLLNFSDLTGTGAFN